MKPALTPLVFGFALSAYAFLVLAGGHASAAAQPQSSVTLSYTVVGNGPFKPPVLWYFSDGKNITTTLTTVPTRYLMDNDSSWGASRILPNGTTYERGAAQYGNFTGSADGEEAVVVYYRQYYATFGAPEASNLTSFSEPLVNYTAFGVLQNATAGSSVWVDYLSPYSYANAVGTPANIRYYIHDPTGVVTSQALIVPRYVEQYLTNFKLDHTGEDTLPSANFTADFGRALTTLTLTAPHRAFWIDANSSITFQPTITPNPNRWVLNSVSEANASNPGNFTVLYFDQYPLTVSFAISSGAAPSGPVLTATADGQPISLELYSGAPPTWVDAGAGYALSRILQGSTSLERWVAVSGTSGVLLGPKSVDLLYYHQVWVSLDYAVVGGGDVSPFNATFVSLGAQNSTLVTGSQAGSWMDVGTTLAVPSTFPGSSSQERWELGSASSYSVQAPQVLSLDYYHQFDVPTGYTIVGGGSPIPSLSGVRLGVPFTSPIAPGEVWLDSGSLFSTPQSLQGATGERWYDSGPLNGTVGPKSTIMPSYQHQYLVTLATDPQGGGSLNGGGWVPSGSTTAVSVTTSGGYLFVSWAGTGAGSYSGQNQSASLSVAGPIVETANFYVGISIQVVGRGSVQVSFGSSTYSVAGRTALFLPAGTNITMIARPSAFETFSGWSGIAAGSAGAVLLTVVSPMGISAVFTLDQVEALAVVALCFGGAAYGIAYFTWKKRVSPGRLLSGLSGSGKSTG